MKKLIYVIILTCSIHSLLFSQTQFQISIGTQGTDVAECIIQTSDGGYALAGLTWSGSFKAYIAKLNAAGSLQWTRTFGGQFLDEIKTIVQTADGGYIAAGSSIFKLDSNGTLEWCKNISGESNSVIQDSDGGFVVAGSTNSYGAGNDDMFIVKLNSSGTLQWASTVGGPGTDLAYSITETLDNSYAMAGWITISGVGTYISICKINASGTIQWARAIGTGWEQGYSIIQAADSGYTVTGRGLAFDSSGNFPFHIAKIDGAGALQWSRTVSLRNYSIPKSIVQTPDEGYAVVGYTASVEYPPPDWYIVKLSSAGFLQWSRIVGGGAGDGDYAYSIIRTLDSGYVVAGGKDSFDPARDMYIVKYDSAWNTCGINDSLVSSFSWGTRDTVITIMPTVTSPTGFIMPRTPIVGSGGSLTGICITGIQSISNETPVSFKLFQNYPNPFNGMTTIKLQIPKLSIVRLIIYDALGREIAIVVNEELRTGIYEVSWDATNSPSGVYFYSLETGNGFIETRKLVLIK